MTTAKTGHPWTAESLFAKAHLYVEQMEEATADDWQHGLWSALSLELLARAALAHISPTLLADASDWRNLMYALGNPPTAKKFSPASISTNEVLRRLSDRLKTDCSVCRGVIQAVDVDPSDAWPDGRDREENPAIPERPHG